MSLLEQMQNDQKAALKAGQSGRLSTLRLLLSAAKNEAIQKMKPLADEELRAVVARQIKQLKDALVDYENGRREDLAAPARQEIEVLIGYLPAQMTDDELSKLIVDTIHATGAMNRKDAGRVIGAVMKQTAGRADGNRARQMIESKLNE